MPAIGEHVQFGVGDGAHRNDRHVQRAHPVVASPRQQGGGRDLVHRRPRQRGVRLGHHRRHLGEGSLAVHPPGGLQGLRIAGQAPAFLDQLVGDQRGVVHHAIQPVDQPLAGGVLGELLQQPDALTGPGGEQIGADAADGDQPAHPLGMLYRQVDCDTATHRVADDVEAVERERVDERHGRSVRGDHRMTAQVGAHAEAGKFQHQTTEVPAERGQHPAEVALARDAGSRAVQEQQRRSVTGVVIAQHPGRSVDFVQVLVKAGCQIRRVRHGSSISQSVPRDEPAITVVRTGQAVPFTGQSMPGQQSLSDRIRQVGVRHTASPIHCETGGFAYGRNEALQQALIT